VVTNDDGIGSPGLLAAVEGLIDLGEVWAIAPSRQQSGQGRSFPFREVRVHEGIMRVKHRDVPRVAIEASPAQTVRHGLIRFVPRLPDLLVSGINYGENVGACITISGTVGAAIEAAGMGVPSIAASLEVDDRYHYGHSTEVDFGPAASFVHRLAQRVIAFGMPGGVDIVKIDVPSSATADTPWRMTRVSRQQYFLSNVTTDMFGKRHLRGYSRQVDRETLEPDSDVHALAVDGVVAVSPLTIDLTANVDLGGLGDALLQDARSACL
jgi:5'-nucleotidase